jgi:beta-glucanase (GH16 family)
MSHNGLELAWAQDFNTPGALDPQWWSFDLGHGHNGWGNRELQHYENGAAVCAVQDGRLVITGLHRPGAEEALTSARIHTHGKSSWQYGRFEFQARLPKGPGTWAAIWMLSDAFYNGARWPHCGEIDIMEYVGRDPGRVHFSLHSQAFNHKKGNHVTESHLVPEVTEGFHTYAMDWDKDGFRFSVDGRELSVFARGDKAGEEAWPFDQPFHLVINLALGGTLGGELDRSALPATFEIGEIRVYRQA